MHHSVHLLYIDCLSLYFTIAKNDKIFDMVKGTTADAIDDELKDCGCEYIYEFCNADTALFSVKLEEGLKFECFISAADLLQRVKALKETIEAKQVLRSNTGTFFIRPIGYPLLDRFRFL